MPNYHATSEGNVPFTAEEETAWATEQAANAIAKAELTKTQYQQYRAKDYPPIGDQLDALWKGGDAATAMLAQVQAVKLKYPKP